MQLRLAIWIAALIALLGLLMYMFAGAAASDDYLQDLGVYMRTTALAVIVAAAAYSVSQVVQALQDKD